MVTWGSNVNAYIIGGVGEIANEKPGKREEK